MLDSLIPVEISCNEINKYVHESHIVVHETFKFHKLLPVVAIAITANLHDHMCLVSTRMAYHNV